METYQMDSASSRHLKLAIRLYDGAWRLAIPWLKRHERLKDGFSQRRLHTPLPPADLWIQAASGGEAYLAAELIRNLHPGRTLRVLVTTNTRQGMEVLEKAASVPAPADTAVSVTTAYFPFDRPEIMDRAVRQVNPKLMVLLETEIWPGLLHALKSAGRPVFIINGRITEKSLSRYSKLPKLLYRLRPDKVLAISNADARRFAQLFGPEPVSVMPNIKFDRVPVGTHDPDGELCRILPPDTPFLVLGSVREEEESAVQQVIGRVRAQCPDVVIGLFPRHMHRLDHWKTILDRMGASWRLRSAGKEPAPPGDIILWDTFGELTGAYAAATAIFVGGSLAPLGGQNFLEPLMYGVVPVIGPSYENFAWIGAEIFDRKLVLRAADWQQAADRLIEQVTNPAPRNRVLAEAFEYIRARQGGTRQACRIICRALDPASEESQEANR